MLTRVQLIYTLMNIFSHRCINVTFYHQKTDEKYWWECSLQVMPFYLQKRQRILAYE